MSNKNNNNKKGKSISERYHLKKKKMLLEMKKEINKLENEIKYFKITNAKIHTIRGLKITFVTCRLIAPFLLMIGITIGGAAIFGVTPFYRDKHKQKLETKKEIDSLGNVRYEQQYDKYENSNSTISYYNKWSFVEDNLYSRDIEVYSLDNITEKTIMKLIDENNISSLEEILGEPISKKKETKNNLSEEELQTESFLQAIIFSKSDDDFIMIKESSGDNIGFTIIWLLVTIFLEVIPAVWRSDYSNFDYSDSIRKIKRKHPLADKEELIKKLEIKRNNYNRLTR